jgi:hypothetical protein
MVTASHTPWLGTPLPLSIPSNTTIGSLSSFVPILQTPVLRVKAKDWRSWAGEDRGSAEGPMGEGEGKKVGRSQLVIRTKKSHKR